MQRIRRKNGQIIEACYVNGKLVTLVPFVNNSAPCSNCALWNEYELKCTFPKDKIKECKIENGTTHGWNTLEYIRVFEEPKDEIISVYTQKVSSLPDSLISQQAKDSNSQPLQTLKY